MSTSRIKQKVLVFSGAVLMLMTVVILVVLLGGAEDPTPTADTPSAAQQPAAAPAPAPPGGSQNTRRPLPGAGKRPPATASQPRVTRTPDAGAGSSAATPPRPDPHVTHSAAPAAEPATITAEKDPTRRQELRKMHRLATAEVRVRLLGRRSKMLRESLANARQDGSWSADKIRREEASLKQIEATVAATKTEVESLKKQLSIRR